MTKIKQNKHYLFTCAFSVSLELLGSDQSVRLLGPNNVVEPLVVVVVGWGGGVGATGCGHLCELMSDHMIFKKRQ